MDVHSSNSLEDHADVIWVQSMSDNAWKIDGNLIVLLVCLLVAATRRVVNPSAIKHSAIHKSSPVVAETGHSEFQDVQTSFLWKSCLAMPRT